MFQSRNRPTPRPAPPRSSPTIAVGQRVFVNCPGGPTGSVGLVDVTGKILSAVQLADGAEVEVIAWRPRVEGDAHYRVRSSSNGADGWLPAGNLRKVLVPLAPAEAPVAKATPMTYGEARRSAAGVVSLRAPRPACGPRPLRPSTDAGSGSISRRNAPRRRLPIRPCRNARSPAAAAGSGRSTERALIVDAGSVLMPAGPASGGRPTRPPCARP